MALRMSAPAAVLSARFSGFTAASPAVAARPSAAGNACRSVTVCAKKGKDIRLMITLECTEQKATGVSGISRYTSEKVRRKAVGLVHFRWTLSAESASPSKPAAWLAARCLWAARWLWFSAGATARPSRP